MIDIDTVKVVRDGPLGSYANVKEICDLALSQAAEIERLKVAVCDKDQAIEALNCECEIHGENNAALTKDLGKAEARIVELEAQPRVEWSFDLESAPAHQPIYVAVHSGARYHSLSYSYVQVVVREAADGEGWYPGTAYAWALRPPDPPYPAPPPLPAPPAREER